MEVLVERVDDVEERLQRYGLVRPVSQGRPRVDPIDGYFAMAFSWTVYEAFASRLVATSEDTVEVEGRLRWMSNGELRDVNASWTLRFDDGRLVSLTASS